MDQIVTLKQFGEKERDEKLRRVVVGFMDKERSMTGLTANLYGRYLRICDVF